MSKHPTGINRCSCGGKARLIAFGTTQLEIECHSCRTRLTMHDVSRSEIKRRWNDVYAARKESRNE